MAEKTEQLLDEPQPVCLLTFVRLSSLLKIVLTSLLGILGIVAAVVAFEYRNGRQIATLQAEHAIMRRDIDKVYEQILLKINNIDTKLGK